MTTREHTHVIDRLHGVFTALITPFTAPEAAEVDLDQLAQNIAAQGKAGVAGVVACGTTGESPTLSDEEYKAIVEQAVRAARPSDLLVIAGAGSNNTAHAVHMHRFAHAAGAHAALHVTPYYNKPSQRGLYEHFMTIADSCALPIVLYNIPGRTGVAIEMPTLKRLATHPNIVAIKEATGSVGNVSRIVEETGLIVLSGDDPLTLPMCSLGARGVISVISNIVPADVAAMCGAIEAGDWDRARRIHQRLLPLAQGLLTLDTNPIPIKTALAYRDTDTGLLRLPMTPPSDTVYERIAQLLRSYEQAAGDAASTVEVKQAMPSHA